MRSSDEERKVRNVSCLRLAVHDIHQFFSGKNKKIILVGLFYYQRLSVFAFSCCSSCGSNDGGGDSSDGGGDSSDGGGDSSDGSTALTRQMRSFQLWVLWRSKTAAAMATILKVMFVFECISVNLSPLDKWVR